MSDHKKIFYAIQDKAKKLPIDGNFHKVEVSLYTESGYCEIVAEAKNLGKKIQIINPREKYETI